MRFGHKEIAGQSGHEAGRALLQELYFQETGQPVPEIAVTERGKPYFVDSPWHFSISHTRHHVFCVLAKNNVAVDAEELGRKISPKLPERVLSPGELAQYAAAPDKTKAFLTFWVLKEAAAKLSGQGLRGFPNDTDFSLTDPRVRECCGCLTAVMEEENAL